MLFLQEKSVRSAHLVQKVLQVSIRPYTVAHRQVSKPCVASQLFPEMGLFYFYNIPSNAPILSNACNSTPIRNSNKLKHVY